MSIANTILVVGATGTVGTELTRLLSKDNLSKDNLSKDNHVKAGTRTPKPTGQANVQSVLYDFDDSSTFDDALAGVDRVFYMSRPADPKALEVATRLVEKAVSAGVHHIVNMSAMGVDANESNALRQIERLIESSGVGFTFLRPNWFLQNFSTGFLGGMIENLSAIVLPVADSATSFVDTRDIAAVAAEALNNAKHKGRSYTLTGNQALTHDDIATGISEASGRSVEYRNITDDEMRLGFAKQGMPPESVDYMMHLFALMKAGYTAPITHDIETVLGRAPRLFSTFANENAGIWNGGAS